MSGIQPFIAAYPREVARLFVHGTLHAPNGNKWNIGFIPGFVSSYKTFKLCLTTAKSALKWASRYTEHIKLIKDCWTVTDNIRTESVDMIRGIPNGVRKGKTTIRDMWHTTPFGWIFGIGKNIVWNFILNPCLKLIVGAIGICIVFPASFIISSGFMCVAKFVLGNVSGISMSIMSVVPLVCGTAFSALASLACITNRFPKDSNDGQFYICRIS